MLLNALPLGAVLFNLVLMSASLVAFWQVGEMVTIGAILCFAILLALSGFENARAYLMFKLSEVGLAEKDEVVSLLLREFEEGDADWLWQIDAGRRIVAASPRFAFAAGREVKDIEGMPLTQLIAGKAWESGNLPPSLHILSEKLTKRESFSNLVVKVLNDDKTLWWELSASPKYDDAGTFIGFRGVGSDVTESRENAEKIARLARYDTLTGSAQPAADHRSAGPRVARVRKVELPLRFHDDRSRPVQVGQRYAGPSGRRPLAGAGIVAVALADGQGRDVRPPGR